MLLNFHVLSNNREDLCLYKALIMLNIVLKKPLNFRSGAGYTNFEFKKRRYLYHHPLISKLPPKRTTSDELKFPTQPKPYGSERAVADVNRIPFTHCLIVLILYQRMVYLSILFFRKFNPFVSE